jgi:hypothetical protein
MGNEYCSAMTTTAQTGDGNVSCPALPTPPTPPAPAELLIGIRTRVRMEYLEMPGLTLTRHQAGRLWNLDPLTCEAILATLVRERFLSQSNDGSFLRREEH